MSCNRCAKEAEAALAEVGVPRDQAMAAFGDKNYSQIGMVWEFLPRCPNCKKWVSPRTGVCNYAHCKGRGVQVIKPSGWPPPETRIVRSKQRAQAAREEARLAAYRLLESLPAAAGLNAEQMETAFDNALGAAGNDPDREEAQRLFDYAARHGVLLPVSGPTLTGEEAYAYSQLTAMFNLPDDFLREAEAIAEAAAAGPVAVDPAGPPPARNLNDHRIDPAADGLGEGGPKAKYAGNVAAIRLLKQLEAENRAATPEEKQILARYVGWGGLAQAFDVRNTWSWTKSDWANEYQELRDLLTDEEYDSARATTPNAHYTSVEVIQGVWQALDRLGVKGGNVLEPSAGIGHFYGLMPEEMAHHSRRTAVEIDSLTGRILQKLYPDADVHVAGYEDTAIAPGSVDVAVGNVPFGDYGVYDPEFDKPELRHLSGRIHNYFFARALRDVKPGGVIAFITSHHTLDAKDSQVRDYLASQADLLGAIRLPNTAFKGNAGTEVTTDIVFLRKRLPDESPGDTSWTNTVQVTLPGKSGPVDMNINRYFDDHPEMMLGTLEATGTMYRGGELTLAPNDDQPLAEALTEAAQRLPAAAAAPRSPQVRCPACGAYMTAGGSCHNPMCPSQRGSAPPELPSAKEKGHLVKDGKVYRREKGAIREVNLKPDEAARVAGLLGLRDSARSLLAQNMTASDEALAAAQADLTTQYDTFVAQHGPIHDRKNLQLLKNDPDLPFLVALEEKGDDGHWQKAALFHKRTIQVYRPPERVDTAQEALLVSLNETGGLEWGRMSALLDKPETEVQQELVEAGLIYQEPGGGFSLTEEYLSGNVRQKLAAAEAAARLDPAYQRNVEALQKVLPETLPYANIKTPLGSAWIPDQYVQQFVTDRLGLRGLEVKYLESTGEFMLTRGRWFNRNSVANLTTWGTSRVSALDLVQDALAGRTPRVYDKIDESTRILNQAETLAAREMLDKIKKEFEIWLGEDESRRVDLEEQYNRLFNSVVPRKYDGSHIVLPGVNPDITLRPHQKNAIWRVAQSPDNVLLGHIVGAGKTFSMIGGAEEYRRLHNSKAMHVVPNHMLDQYSADVRRLYPNAKVLAISARDIGNKDKRAELMSRIATGDHTAIVVTHDAFNRIPIKPETEASFIRQELQTLEAQLVELVATEGKKAPTVKQIEKAKKRLEARLKKVVDRQDKDDFGLTFEDLGLGIVCVDEAHMYKNLEIQTRRDRLAGIPQGGSARAFDMYIKTQYMSRRCRCGQFVGQDGLCRNCRAGTKIEKGKVVFATGTPVANSMAEAYVMQKMLDYNQLKELGLHHFDNWASMFGDTVTALEMKPSGDGYREFTRWAKFHNVPELMSLWRNTADFETDPTRLGIPRPALKGGKAEGVSAPSSEWLKNFIQDCANRAENLHQVDPTEDNMLKIVSDARKAALDPRLIDPSLPDEPDSKTNVAVREMMELYRRSTGLTIPGQEGPENMAQMVFLDMSAPTYGRQHKAYQALKAGLAEAGQPDAERTAANLMLAHWPLPDETGLRQALVDTLGEEAGSQVTAALQRTVGFGQPGTDRIPDDFNVYDDLKLKLIAQGVPEAEIAFIHDAQNDEQKLALFEKVNAGQVRYLFGSTQKMGTGTNAQKRLIGLHHLDAPWRPADVEQREGRILRQGNINPEIEIKRYATEGSFDTYMWQTLETKARFISQLLSDPDNPAREFEDLDAMTIGYAEMKALATGNPIMIEQIELQQKLKRLDGLHRAYLNKQRATQGDLKHQEDILTRAKTNKTRWERVQAAAPPPLADFAITLDGGSYDAKAKQEAGKRFMDLVESYSSSTRQGVVGQINGYNIHLRGQGHGHAPRVYLEFDKGILAQVDLYANGTRSMTEVMRTANDYPTNEIERSTNVAASATQAIRQLQTELDQPFEKDEEYQQLQGRLREVDAELEKMRRVEQEVLLRNVDGADEAAPTLLDEALDDARRMAEVL